MTPPPATLLQGVSFAYDGVLALQDVDLTLQAGDFASIVGPNGGGKTTLLKLVLGLLEPNTGRVETLGTLPRRARSRIGYTPQRAELDPQFPVNVMDVVLMGRLGSARLLGPFTCHDHRLADQALAAVDMQDFQRRAFSALSGGQRQRVLIARALASEPEMLLLDEPTQGLDIEAETNLYSLLRSLNEHMTVVIVSHDVGMVSHLVNTVICVRRRVIAHPTSQLTGDLLRDTYGADFCLVRHDHDHTSPAEP